jgi:parallel beta-helix repeat protein
LKKNNTDANSTLNIQGLNMKNKFINTAIAMIMLLSLAAAAIPLALPAPPAQANGCTPPPAGTWYVDDNGAECSPYCYYSTIQEAINTASAGDTIIVYNGTYNNANLTINKPLTIISQNGSASTFINGGGSGIAVSIDASNVTFGTAGHGFTVSFGGQPGIAMYPNEGTEMTGISIVGNVMDTCTQGIVFEFEGIDSSYDFHNNTITGNTIYDCNWAMWFDTSHEDTDIRDNTITGNTIYNCEYDAITFYNDNGTGDIYGNTITGNTIHDYTGTGIYLENDGNNNYTGAIRSNNISANTVYNTSGDGEGGGGFGIRLVNNQYYSTDISDNIISGNEVYNCSEYGIYLNNWLSTGQISGNSISGNTVYDCDTGIELREDGSDGEIYQNIIAGNNIHNCQDCLGLYSMDAASIHGNTIEGNTVHDFIPYGIYLRTDGGHVYGNSVSDNTVYNASDGAGIYLYACGGGNTSENTVRDNTVYQMSYTPGYGVGSGIQLYAVSGGDILNSTVEGNTVYGWNNGISLCDTGRTTIQYIDILDNVLYNESEEIGNDDGIDIGYCNDITVSGNDIRYSTYDGIYVDYSEDIDITGNTVYYTEADDEECAGIMLYYSEDIDITGNTVYYTDSYYEYTAGIYIWNSGYIYVCSNDIRYNDTDASGILVEDSGYITVTCNNIVDNWSWCYDDYVGLIGEDVDYGVYADDNWWGDPSGPGYGDAAYGDVYLDYWLEEEVTLLTDAVIDYAAVPATVSLYDADGLFGSEYYEADPIYTLGPSYTDIIVEVECTDSPCGIQLATVNLSTLLLDMLPADFQQRYVDTWDADLQEDWEDWLDDISNMEMPYYSTDDTCFYDFEFYLNDLLFSGWDCGETDYPCWGLEDFFFEEYSYEEAYMKLGILLFEELRLGNFEVPVTVYTCCDEDYCCNSYTVYVPLAVVDFQLPLEAGWNLRSTPISLDGNYSTFGDILSLGDGMPGLEVLITYNASSGLWELPGKDTVMEPLSAYYLKMSSRDQLGYIINRNSSNPPERHLYEGWNLVSLAAPFDYPYQDEWYWWPSVMPFLAMEPWDALDSATGWLIAMNPAEDLEYEESFYYKDIYLSSDSEYLPYKPPYYKYFYQEPWLAFSNSVVSGEPPFLTPGGGFWVFMENEADLTGNSSTPYPWEEWWNWLD